MKTTTFFAITLLATINVKSQTYLDSSSTWFEYEGYFDGFKNHSAKYTYTLCGDTFLFGKTFHQVWKAGIDSVYDSNGFLFYDTLDYYYAALRETNNSFYASFPNNTQDYLIYNFNATPGQNISSSGCSNLIVSSLSSVTFGTQTLKKIILNNNFSYTEGIGAWTGLFGRLCIFWEYDSRLICYKKNGTTFINDTLFACSNMITHNCLSSGINDNSSEMADILIFPNPTTIGFNLIFNKNIDKQKIELINTLGQSISLNSIKVSEFEITVDLSSIDNGIYFLRFGNNFKKLIKVN